MPFMNLTYGLIVHEDQSEKTPTVKMPDISKSIQNVIVDNDRSDRLKLAPGETKDIVTTARATTFDGTTEVSVLWHIDAGDNVRYIWTGTGTNPNFRTNRNIGGSATTEVTMTRLTPYVIRVAQTAGTTWTLGSVSTGDTLKIEKTTDAFTSPFNTNNQGRTFTVQAKGANYIDVIDNGTASLDSAIVLGTDFAFALRVFSSSGVKIGDTVSISGSINPSNQGKFTIVDVSPDYIEVVNPFAYEETFLYGSNNITVYDHLIGYLHLRATGPISVRYDAQTEWASKGRLGNEVLMLESPSSYKIQAKNDDPVSDVIISVQYGTVLQ